ncbi:MAG TPA: DUF4199 domain-containing protein [Gemmatimonadales bacterium]|nr:DUF4199 domain-containing protein [Gemmatimonadales bacterium]
MRRFVLTYGLIGGAILSALMFITFLGFHDQIGFGTTGLIVGYTGMVMGFLMVYFGVKAYRDSVAPEGLSFGRAFKVGLLITLVATVCYVASWQVIYYGFAPDFMDQYAAYSLEEARQAGASGAELAEKAAKMEEFKEMYRNPLVNIGFTFLEPLPVGLVFTLVTAGVLGRKRRVKEPAAA